MIKLLIIDDETDFREVLTERLASEGYFVSHQASADAAIADLSKHSYDLIILDLILERASPANIDWALSNLYDDRQGIAVLQYLKSNGIETPVLAISNKADDRITELLCQYPQCSFGFKSRLTQEGYIRKTLEAILSRKMEVSSLQAAHTPLYLLRGIPRKLHYLLRQYMIGFEQYLKHFKGRSEVRIEVLSGEHGANDDMAIRFHPPFNSRRIFYWFKEYIQWLESGNTIQPLAELPIQHQELGKRTQELQEEVAYFASTLADRYWDQVWGTYTPAASSLAYEGIIELNPIKVSNSFQLRQGKQRLTRSLTAYQDLEKQVYQFLQENRSIEALDALLHFCTLYRLHDLQKQVLAQQAQYANAIQFDPSGHAFASAVAAINLNILYDLLPELETAVQNLPAGN
ncbi:MAG: response regulator [Bacteroidetes bacterium]|nr:response regulator [Bacteroidota bacterium]